ncbi:MAG: fatty acid desaturase [Leptospirales bacterium]
MFALIYLINITYMSVFYHRAFTHRAVTLRPWFQRFIVFTGPWVTGMDIKAWACMHRLHHKYSDTRRDPHSPMNGGIWSVFLSQVWSYKRVTVGLTAERRVYTSIVRDLDFPVAWFHRIKNGSWIPYAANVALALAIAIGFDAWILGFAYIAGAFIHPIHGWAINAFGHAFGYRNFERNDHSKNHMPTALLILGEGFQNNHHQYPSSAKFSARAWEFDAGFLICRILEAMRLVRIKRAALIPARP